MKIEINKNIKETKDELDKTIANQIELIESEDFELAEEIQTDINYLKGKLKDTSVEFNHIM